MAVTEASLTRSGGHGRELRDTIRALMGITKTNQTLLARQLGLSQPNLSKRLSGEVSFSEDDLDRIAGYFHLDGPADLYDTQRAVSLCVERFPRLRWIAGTAGQGTLFDLLVAA